MPHQHILNKENTALVIVDFQEAFREMIPGFDEIGASISKIACGFQILDLPIVVTEQYPRGLGHTAVEVLDTLSDDFTCIEKTAFSSCGASEFVEQLKSADITQVLLCGLETHICVNQTAHDLINEGFDVHVLEDSVGSRSAVNKQIGLNKMSISGAIPSCVEMALFELMKDSQHENFKEIQSLIK